jgi:hypothetical protein
MEDLNEKQIEANRIIDAMGGTSKVAEIFSITTGGVSQWRDDGIPDSRMFSIKLLRPDLFDDSKIAA